MIKSNQISRVLKYYHEIEKLLLIIISLPSNKILIKISYNEIYLLLSHCIDVSHVEMKIQKSDVDDILSNIIQSIKSISYHLNNNNLGNPSEDSNLCTMIYCMASMECSRMNVVEKDQSTSSDDILQLFDSLQLQYFHINDSSTTINSTTAFKDIHYRIYVVAWRWEVCHVLRKNSSSTKNNVRNIAHALSALAHQLRGSHILAIPPSPSALLSSSEAGISEPMNSNTPSGTSHPAHGTDILTKVFVPCLQILYNSMKANGCPPTLCDMSMSLVQSAIIVLYTVPISYLMTSLTSPTLSAASPIIYTFKFIRNIIISTVASIEVTVEVDTRKDNNDNHRKNQIDISAICHEFINLLIVWNNNLFHQLQIQLINSNTSINEAKKLQIYWKEYEDSITNLVSLLVSKSMAFGLAATPSNLIIAYITFLSRIYTVGNTHLDISLNQSFFSSKIAEKYQNAWVTCALRAVSFYANKGITFDHHDDCSEEFLSLSSLVQASSSYELGRALRWIYLSNLTTVSIRKCSVAGESVSFVLNILRGLGKTSCGVNYDVDQNHGEDDGDAGEDYDVAVIEAYFLSQLVFQQCYGNDSDIHNGNSAHMKRLDKLLAYLCSSDSRTPAPDSIDPTVLSVDQKMYGATLMDIIRKVRYKRLLLEWKYMYRHPSFKEVGYQVYNSFITEDLSLVLSILEKGTKKEDSILTVSNLFTSFAIDVRLVFDVLALLGDLELQV